MGRSFWETIRRVAGKPVLITEFGNSAYGKERNEEEIESFHADYHRGNWEDIERNMTGGPGQGNALGGVVFEFCDEWWKDDHPDAAQQSVHSVEPQWAAPYCDGFNYEEWYGLYGIGNGEHSPFLRQPRKAVEYYTQAWKKSP
jgi:beta-glucuronidase